MSKELKMQEKLAKIKSAISYALWLHDSGGTPQHNRWVGGAREAITLLTELQEELKPNAVDVEKVAKAIHVTRMYNLHYNGIAPSSWETEAQAAIVEIERQKSL